MYPLGRQDLTQQGAGKSWVGVLPSSDLRSRVGQGGLGSRPAGWGRRLKVGDSDGGSKDRVEPQCRAGRSSFPLQRSSSLLYTGTSVSLAVGGVGGRPVSVGVTSVENPKKGRCGRVIGTLRSGGWVVVCATPPH